MRFYLLGIMAAVSWISCSGRGARAPAVPETKLTFQSVFRYLRHLTGNEIAVDGETLVDGDNVTIKARVAGNPPRAVKGKLADWESLLGELANYVYETTQPAVLASYLGLTANTPEELVMLSRYIEKMVLTKVVPLINLLPSNCARQSDGFWSIPETTATTPCFGLADIMVISPKASVFSSPSETSAKRL